MQKTRLDIRNVPCLLQAASCTGLTNLLPGHNVNVPPMSATEGVLFSKNRVSPEWLGSSFRYLAICKQESIKRTARAP